MVEIPRPEPLGVEFPQSCLESDQRIEDLGNKHEQFIDIILKEEEQIIASHRSHIDEMVDRVKNVRKPFSHNDPDYELLGGAGDEDSARSGQAGV